METIWIVYAHTASGERFALAAYKDQETADAYAIRCNQPMHIDEKGRESMSPAEMLRLTLTVSPLKVML
jgi:hypothetical protein